MIEKRKRTKKENYEYKEGITIDSKNYSKLDLTNNLQKENNQININDKNNGNFIKEDMPFTYNNYYNSKLGNYRNNDEIENQNNYNKQNNNNQNNYNNNKNNQNNNNNNNEFENKRKIINSELLRQNSSRINNNSNLMNNQILNQNNIITNPPLNEEKLKRFEIQEELKKQIEEKSNAKKEYKKKEKELELLEIKKFDEYLKKKKEQENNQLEKRKNKNNKQLLNQSFESNNNKIKIQNEENIIKNSEYNKDNNIELNYQRNISYEEKSKLKHRQEIEKFKEMIGLTYDNLTNIINEKTNDEIFKLKYELNRQYGEVNDIIHKLKKDVKDSNILKLEAENGLNKIKSEIEKTQNIESNNKIIELTEMPERINNKMNNFQSLRNIKEKREPIIKNNQSNLAKIGQNLIGVSEFVSIPEPKKMKKMNEDSELVTYDKSPSFNNNKYYDMYDKLNEIANLNHQMNYVNKYTTNMKYYENDIKNKNIYKHIDTEIKEEKLIKDTLGDNTMIINNSEDVSLHYDESARIY